MKHTATLSVLALSGLLAGPGCKGEPEASGQADPSPDAASPADAADAAEPAATKAEPPPTGLAVLRPGALLFSSSTGSDGFEVPPVKGAAGVTVHIAGAQDERLIVETLVAQPPQHHCAGTLDGLKDFRLRMYVAPDDLLPVLTADHEIGNDDGTKIVLAPGVPVPPDASPLWVDGTPLAVTIPSAALGRVFEPRAPDPRGEAKGMLVPATDGADPLTYGGQQLTEGGLPTLAGAVAHHGIEDKGTHALVTLRTRCTTLVVKANPDRVGPPAPKSRYAIKGPEDPMPEMAPVEEGHFLASPYGSAFAVGGDDEDVWGGLTGAEVGEAYGVGGLGLVGSTKTEYEIKPGAAVLWSDGTTVGQVVAAHRFDDEPHTVDGRSCFTTRLTESGPATLQLCFAAGDVSKVEPEEAFGVGGLGLVGTGRGGGGTGEGTIGLGNTGLIGKGGGGGSGSGYGRGSGAGFGGRGRPVPRVRAQEATVKGSLDKDIIRRIVRAHINEVRYCYNQGLKKEPTLEGKVSVQFTISAAGKVPVATVASTTLSDKDVANCSAKAFKRWRFPKPPAGDVVVVTYPLSLTPG